MIRLLDLCIRGDDRGSLISLEQNKNIPFDIKRVYYIYGTKENVRRGFHAHRDLQQVLISVSGNCKILIDDGTNKQNISLEAPNVGLLISGLEWREMYDFSSDCVLMVLASDYYDEADYIRNYDDFLEEIRNV